MRFSLNKSQTLVPLLSLIFCTSAIILCQTREQTTIQSVSATVKGKPDAIVVKYLDLPWGEKTFEYVEKGEDNYYGTRSWPFARMIVSVPVRIEDHQLSPGSYALVLNPAKKSQPLAITLIKLPDDKEFLQPGNVFVEVPSGQAVFSSRRFRRRRQGSRRSYEGYV